MSKPVYVEASEFLESTKQSSTVTLGKAIALSQRHQELLEAVAVDGHAQTRVAVGIGNRTQILVGLDKVGDGVFHRPMVSPKATDILEQRRNPGDVANQ